jgi:PAS domain S-box-containing protein
MDNKKKKEMEDSEEKYRLLAKSSPFGISIISKEGVYEYINPKFTEMFGYTSEDITTGKDWFKKAFPDPKYRKKVVALWINDFKKAGIGESRPRIFTVICKDGSKKEIQFIPVTLSDGKQFVTYEDITEQKKTEEKLSTIYDLSKEMTLSLDLDQISKMVLDAAEKVLNFSDIDLFLVGEEKNELYLIASRGWKERKIYTRVPLSGEKGITAYVARTGEALNIPDVRKDKRYLVSTKEVRSELCAPIKIKNKIIGVIDAESEELNAFSEEDQRLLEILASEAGIAIENAKLYESVEKNIKEFSLIQDVGNSILSILDIDKLLSEIIDKIKEAFRYNLLSLLLIDENKNELYFATASGYSKEVMENLKFKIGKEGIVGRVAKEGKPQLIDDVTKCPYYIGGFETTTKSEIAVPLKIKDKVIGVLDAQKEIVNGFSERDVRILSNLAIQISIAIENARLFTELSSLKEFNETIVSSLNEGIWVEDEKSFCTYANHRMEEMLGYESLVGKHWEEIIVPEEIDRMVKETKTRAHGRESSYETVLLTNSGEKIPVIVSATPLFEEGKFVGTMGVFVDIREQKRVEESRKESEKLYKSLSEFNKNLLENSPIGIMNINKEMKVEYENPEMRRILGLPFGRELSATWRNIQEVPFVEETGISSIFDELRKGKEIFKEISFTFPEGERGYLTLKGVPILEDSKFAGAVLLVNDITGLKGAEEKLRESEEKYRLISEGTSDMIAMTTFALNPVYTYVSSSIKRIMGYEPEDMIGKSGLDFIHPDNKKKLLPLLRKYITAKAKKLLTGKDSEISEIIEYRAIDKLGKWHYLQSTVNLVGNQMLFVSRDITEEKKMEETLRKSEERFRILFERIPEATVYTDENIRIIGVNPKFEELFGYSRDEIIGRNLNDLVIPEDKMEEAKRLDKKSIKGGYASSDTVRKRKDGSLIPVSISGGPIIIGSSKIGMVTVYKDITEQKKAEEVLHQRAVQADLINKVGQRVGSELELKILLSEIVNSVRDTFDYYGVMLLLRSEDTDYLILQSITGGYSDIFLEDLSIKIGEGVIGYAAKIGKTQISGDVTKNPYYVRKADEITKSELSVPIMSKQKEVIGVLDIQSDEFDAFSDADVIAMETLSTQIAAAIENARLYEQAQKDIREREKTEEELQESKEKIEQLHKIAAQMESVQSEDEVYQLIIDAAKRILEFSICSVSIVDGDRLEIKATSYEEIPKDRYMAIDEGVMGRTYRTGKSYLIDDIKKDKDAKPTEEKFRSALSVPIWNIGVFLGIADEFNAFTQNDLEMTELLISHATEALKRIQSEKALREERDRAQKYLDVAGVLMVVLDADQKVTLINKKGCEMLGYKEEEIIGKNWTDNFTPEEIKDEVKIVYEKLFTGEVEPVKYNENPILTKSGEERIVAWHNSVLKDETGNIVGILSSGEDITERKKAEKSLKESEERYKELVQNANSIVMRLDTEGNITFFNEFAQSFFGYAENEIIGRNLVGTIVPKIESSGRDLEALIEDLKRDPDRYAINENENMRKNGERVWVLWTNKPILDDRGRIVGILCIGTDATERKKAEEKLEESRKHFQMLFDVMVDPVVIVDSKGKFLEITDKLEEITGYKKEEFLGKNFFKTKIVTAKSKAILIKNLSKRMMGMKVAPYEIEVLTKNGRKLPYEVNAAKIEYKGKPADMVVFRDVTERKKMEEALKKERDKAQEYLDTVGAMLMVVDADQKISLMNKKGCEILEGTEKEIIGKNWFDDFIPERNRKKVKASFEKVIAGELNVTKYGEYSALAKSGEEKIIAWHNVLLKDEQGNIIGILSSGSDITERKKIEEELRESERELSTIFNSTKDGIVLLNKTGKIIKINKRITEVGGYTEKDIVGKRFSAFKFFTLKSLSKTAIAFTKIMADVEVPPFEVELKTKEGKKLYLETYVYPVKKNEKIVGIVSILRNITERKKAEESLRESEEKFRTLTENINIGIYRNTVGPEGKFIEANSAIIQMFGYSDKEEFLNVNVSGLYQHPEDREKFSQKMLKDGFVRNEELQLKKKDGTLFYGSVSAVAVKDETGKVKYYDGMIEDITEQKKAEEALKRSEEKYKSLIKQLPIGVYRTTEEGKILHANPALASILEYESVEELMKSYAINVYIDPAIREKQLKEWRSKKGVTSNEIELRTKTGRQIWVRDTGRVILDENGEISYVDGTIENVTEWKKAEQIQLVLYKIANTVNITKDLNELFRSIHNTLGTIIDTKNFYIALYDKEKELLSFPYYIDENYPEREATTVTSRKSVKGLTEYVIKIGKGLLVTKKEIEELAEKGEIELIGTLPLFWLGVPLKLNEKTFGVIAVQTYSSSTTCTEQDVKLLEFVSDQIAIAIRHKQADEEKEKSRKEAEFYSDVLGHDVGNINQVISGYLYLLKNAKDEETRKKNVKGIKKSIEKSKRLAESIKTLKIIKDTKIEKFDLNKSIERSIKEIKEYFDREIEVNLNIDKKYYVNANDFLDKVFFNIFENSVEYTFHDPVIIDVKTEEKDGFCSVHIHDNGLGISKEKREDILENLETLSKRTGIGFYLTKKILERFNGKFEIKDVKKGTGIVISIPVINGCSVRNVHAQRSDERNERRGRES